MLRTSWGGTAAALMLVAQAVTPPWRGPTELAIDAGESRVTILVGKAGLLSFAGHAHEVVAPAVRGRVSFDPMDWPHASVSLEFDAAALRVTGKGEPSSNVPDVQRAMLGEKVLDVQRFPTVAFQSRRLSVAFGAAGAALLTIDGDMTLRGTTRPVTVQATATADAAGRVTATGAFKLKQTDFGMEPVTAAGGTIRVKDEINIQFVLKASPVGATTTSRW